jgi:hypothetical protein
MLEGELWVPLGIAFTAIADAFQRDRWIAPTEARKWMTIDLYRQLKSGRIRAWADTWHYDHRHLGPFLTNATNRPLLLSGQGEMPAEWWTFAGTSETLLKRGSIEREGLRAKNVHLEVSGHRFADAVRPAFAPDNSGGRLNQRLNEPYSEDEIRAWVNHTRHTDMKTARTAFMLEPRAKGLSATFEVIWNSSHGHRKRGRPRKPVEIAKESR